MSQPRRPIAAVLTLAIGWTALVLGLVAPPAAEAADVAHDPATYYAGTDGLTGAALEAKLHSIVHDHTFLSYDQLWSALQVTDRDPDNPNHVIDVYSGTSLVASNMCNTGGACPTLSWNREHSWAKSHGDFGTVSGPGTDLFHMRPELADVNSTRGNLDFDDGGSATITNCSPCTKDGDSFSPRAAIRGDIARGLFYMAVAYDGGDGFPDLQLNDYTCNAGSKAPLIGKLSTLVRWSQADPPDALEQARNNVIDASYQHNRNPFIDHPEWVASIWGDGVGQGPTCGTTTGGGGTGGGGTGGTPPENIVISEAYLNGGSTNAIYKNKYVELYNPLDSTVDLSAYSLQYRSATGTGAASGIYNFAANARIASHHYFVVQLASNGPVGGPLPQVDAATTSVNPGGAAGGTLFLAGTHSTVAPDDDSVGDLVGYGSSNAPETAAAPTGYSVTKSLQRNAASSDTDDNSVDFTNATPTPGTAVDGTGGNPTVSPFTAASNGSPVGVPLSGTDVYGDPLAWTVASQPQHGQVSITGSTATYTPEAGFSGTDVATVTAANNHSGSTATTLTVTVTNTAGGNHAPIASPVDATTDEDVATTVPLAATDADDDALTWQVTAAPAHGTASVAGSTLTYTPVANFHGEDTLGVTVSDGHGGSATTTVTVTVQPVNDAPTATDAEATTAEDTAVTFAIHGTDVDDDALTYAIKTQPEHGSVSLTGDQATYTPDQDFHGQDAFTWTVSDGSLTATGAASVTVSSVNDAPTASALEATTEEDTEVAITLAGQDVDGDQTTYSVSSPPSHGDVTIVGDEATYVPDSGWSGPDSFTYTASDGLLSSAPASVSITVAHTNHAPTVTGAHLETTALAPVTATLATSDPDGDAVTILSATDPTHGSVEVDGTSVTYTPTVRSGDDAFTVTVADGHGGTASAQVTVTVSALVAHLEVATPEATRGSAVTSTVTATGASGATPSGEVTLRSGDSVLGTGTLDEDGVALVTWIPGSAGDSTLTATYEGDERFDASTSTPESVTVQKSRSALRISGKHLRAGHAGTIRVRVATVAGVAADGRMTITVGGTKHKVTVRDGVAALRVDRLPRRAAVTVEAKYVGNDQYAAGTISKRLRLKH